jgi:hypothetical protein
MTYAQVILCEKSGRWAAALRRALGQQTVPVAETRSLAQCGEALRTAPASLVALEVTGTNLEAAVSLIVHARREHPAARIGALLDDGAEPVEMLLREAGAVDVLHATRDAPRLAGLALRHLALAPRPELPLREQIAERLPWKRSQTPEFATQLQQIASPSLS